MLRGELCRDFEQFDNELLKKSISEGFCPVLGFRYH
jgi:hypothetical protein